METSFYISLSIKVPSGFETLAQFYLGNDWKTAETVFSKLKGQDEVSEKSMLYMDLTETQNGVPFTGRLIHCNLEEVASNVRIITREAFKRHNLEG